MQKKTKGAPTPDDVIGTRTPRHVVKYYYRYEFRRRCGEYKFLISSVILSIFGVLQVVFPPYDMMLYYRIKMTPGLPPFDWWLDPPDQVIAKVYIFNVTNPVEFSNGSDKKIKLKEVGPIIYREKLRHDNVAFNDNSTLSYTANRSLIYLPDRNPVDLLKQTITMPNLPILVIPSFFYDSPFYVRLGVNLMIRRLKTETFKTATVEDFLWNMTDPLMDTSRSLAPGLVPISNFGILTKVYREMQDNLTVLIGPGFASRDFFKIDRINGNDFVPLNGDCRFKMADSSEGVAYHQSVSRNDTIKYYRKTFCGIANLFYAGDTERYGLSAYRFELDNATYDRSRRGDCYAGAPELPGGLRDVSSCNFDTSIAASNPHFLHAEPALIESFEGLEPDPALHTSYIDVEPVTGVPLEGSAKCQINLAVKDLSGFTSRLHKFSNLNIPLAWIEYKQEGLPDKIKWLLYILVNVMPAFQIVLASATFLSSAIFLLVFLIKQRRLQANLKANKALAFEKETFLSK
ncbi:unnamed protein product [Phyllotreta striolata]|uniref:Scavenger receptor class B member 1-like n=1 Tax=Phyllotreta striolata TaxID=444603 RepID=A0A9N9TL49_PHYSR|nr:unnamed protein product [Phyllotreta striolata]